jgi:hypothetical protein
VECRLAPDLGTTQRCGRTRPPQLPRNDVDDGVIENRLALCAASRSINKRDSGSIQLRDSKFIQPAECVAE